EIPILTECLTMNKENEFPKKNSGIFYTYIVGAVLKALKLTKRHEQVRLANLFFKSVDMHVLFRMPFFGNYHHGFLDLAELALMAESDACICIAFYAVCAIYNHLEEKDPIAEEAGVRIVNRGVKLALRSQDIQLKTAALNLIDLVQKSEYC